MLTYEPTVVQVYNRTNIHISMEHAQILCIGRHVIKEVWRALYYIIQKKILPYIKCNT